MSGLVSFKLEGMAELHQQLDELGAELGTKALAQAARKAFKPVFEAARRLVPVGDTAELAFAIRMTTMKVKADGTIAVGLRIGGGKGSANPLPPARRWHWIEFGTAQMAAHPFLRPAMDENAAEVLELLKAELTKSIEKAIKKRARGK